MELHEVVMKLVGPVQPVGETREDEKRLRNLRELTVLVAFLMSEIHLAASQSYRREASVKAIGGRARNFMKELNETLSADIEGKI